MSSLLIELLTEELPTHAVMDLSLAGSAFWAKTLQETQFSYGEIIAWQTPRRLAWQILDFNPQQAAQQIERRGPAVNRARNADGSWSPATLGFAQSCGTTPEALQERDGYLYFQKEEAGKNIRELLPSLFQGLVEALPIAKRMRWGDFEQSFVRPVLRLVALLDDEILPLDYFGIQAGRETLGHRVHHPQPVLIPHALAYAETLRQAFVLPSLAERKENIRQQIMDLAAEKEALPVMPEALLDEVAALVEYPVALLGEFAPHFLDIPQEVLMTTMQDNQKSFALTDAAGKMLPYFIAVANLNSRAPEVVRRGNEKVIRPRFEDAQFFWEQDLKRPLAELAAGLAKVTHHAKLGSVADKVQRLEALVVPLCAVTGANPAEVQQAARLCKADLLSGMVGEFPELQGVMGMHYARRQGYADEIARAIAEHYQPLGAGAALPESACGITLALAEKIETLLGGFAVGAKPTGSKDPYALRRNAIALIRLLIEKRLPLNLREILSAAAVSFPEALRVAEKIPEILAYVAERLQHHYREQGVPAPVYQAVAVFYAARDLDVLDFDARLRALQDFLQAQDASDFLASAKRIRNILKKNGTVEALPQADLYQEAAERQLAAVWEATLPAINEALQAGDYPRVLQTVTSWSEALSAFFNDVMVMAEDERLRHNRLALLTQLQNTFLQLADLSEL